MDIMSISFLDEGRDHFLNRRIVLAKRIEEHDPP